MSKLRNYWKAPAAFDRGARLLDVWGEILEAMDVEIAGVVAALPRPAADAPYVR